MRLLVPLLLSVGLVALQAQPPAPVTERWITGNLEVGNRWVSDVGGDFNTYRSVVNLGEGPKLLGLDFVLTDSSRRVFDKINVRANSWGGDPYNTARIDVERQRAYNLSVDYHNVSYFNFLPSFANPTADRGILLNQRSFDIQRRFFDAHLDLRPGSKIVPYVAYSRDWGAGRGITDFVVDANEFAVANDLRDRTNHFRGGVRFELNRFHVTLEEGGTTFKDHQRVFHSGLHLGNRSSPILGERLSLSALEQQYRVGGDSIYSKGLITANPASWLNVYGQFLYSRPESDLDYTQDNTGRFVLLNPPVSGLRFFDVQQSLLTSEAKQPHTSGSFAAELRPHRRLRIMESWMTDRFHTTGAALLTETFSSQFTSTTRTRLGAPGLERLVLNYNRQEVNVLFDVTSKVTLRGGHRYVWGDAQIRAPQLSQTGPREASEMRMHVGLAGLTFRAAQKLNVNLDFEGSSADRTYFRTSLNDYQRTRIRARYQVLSSLLVAASFSVLNNENPAPSIRFDFLSRNNSVSVFWTPRGGKWISLLGEYTRSSLRSDLTFLDPLSLTRDQSFYRENGHNGTTILDLNLPAVNQVSPKLSIGGSLFVSSGSRPTRYYQPLGKFSFPLHKRVQWFAEWRWYNLAQPFYLFEGFRTHQFIAGLRLAL